MWKIQLLTLSHLTCLEKSCLIPETLMQQLSKLKFHNSIKVYFPCEIYFLYISVPLLSSLFISSWFQITLSCRTEWTPSFSVNLDFSLEKKLLTLITENYAEVSILITSGGTNKAITQQTFLNILLYSLSMGWWLQP